MPRDTKKYQEVLKKVAFSFLFCFRRNRTKVFCYWKFPITEQFCSVFLGTQVRRSTENCEKVRESTGKYEKVRESTEMYGRVR